MRRKLSEIVRTLPQSAKLIPWDEIPAEDGPKDFGWRTRGYVQ
jgi:hypothetical protein